MKITIIGCGWLGLPLGKQLLSIGHDVYGSTRHKSKVKELREIGISPFIINVDGTIEEKDVLKTDVLIITIPPFSKDQPDHYVNFLQRAIEQFKHLKQVIFTSSTGIYPKKNGIYSEQFIFLEKEKSSILFRAESVIKDANQQSVILRLGGLFGPNRHPALNLAGKRDVSNPFGRINFIHQQDVINAISLCVEQEVSGLFNLVYPEHPYRKDYYTWVFRHYGLMPISFNSDSSIDRIISSEKALKELCFVAQHSINDLDSIISN